MEEGWKRNRDLSGSRNDALCAVETQTGGHDRKRKNENHNVEKKGTDSAVVLSSGSGIDDCMTLPGGKEESDSQVTIRTACRGKHFTKTMSSLSAGKLVATIEMGFGSLYEFRCTKVNLPLCQVLVENFDVANSSINIHGRNLTITHEDFERIMGVRNGGCDVEVEGNTEDPDILALERKISGKENQITIHGLRRVLIESESADEIFRISFALYALATLLSPVTGIHVERRYLIPLKDPNGLCSKNWAKFAFDKLVEGVSLFQGTGIGLAGGCILFLQLFYLDIVSNGMFVLPKTVKPVMIWGADEAKKIYEQVESMGGWKSESVYVTKRYLWDRTIQYSGSVDASTGIKTNVVEDLSEVMSDVGVVKGDIRNLKSMVGQLGPDMCRLRSAIMTLETSLEKLKAEGLCQLVSDTIMGVFEDKQNDYVGNDGTDVFVDGQKQHGPEFESDDDGMPNAKSKIVISNEVVAYRDRSTEVERNEQTRFEAVAEISERDAYLLAYLFSKKVSADNSFGSNEVARFEDSGVSRWDLSCLSPTQSLTAEVVNISAAYLCQSGSENWFLPATVSERAKEISAGMLVEAIVPSTITLCKLGRFIGRLSSCNKMFLPIHDGVVKHWFLAVVNIPDAECEIWDSNPVDSANTRRQEYAIASMCLLEKVFGNELRMAPDLYARFGSFSISYPESCPLHPRSEDSGIFVIRNMQFYRQRWYLGFNSGDQRVRMALEIVNHPTNEIRERVWSAASEEVPYDVPTTGVPPLSLKEDAVLPTSGMKFNPRRSRRG